MAAQCNFSLVWNLISEVCLGKPGNPCATATCWKEQRQRPLSASSDLGSTASTGHQKQKYQRRCHCLNLPGKYSHGVLLLSALPHLCQCHWTSGSDTSGWSFPWEQTEQEAMRVVFQKPSCVFQKGDTHTKLFPVQHFRQFLGWRIIKECQIYVRWWGHKTCHGEGPHGASGTLSMRQWSSSEAQIQAFCKPNSAPQIQEHRHTMTTHYFPPIS